MENELVTALKELAEDQQSRSKIAQLRELMPYIENARKSGVKLDVIHAKLKEKGFDITIKTFKGTYQRIKKEIAEKPPVSSSLTTTADITQKEILQTKPHNQITNDETISTNDDNADLSGLNAKQRREKLGERFIKPESTNPILKDIMENKK